MKITFHKKIAAYFGYEFTRISSNKYQNQNTHIQALIELHGIDIVLDVGANMGQFALDLRKAGYNGQIISFEPVNECYQHLVSIADEKWQIKNYALGDMAGKESINISHKSVFSSILETNEFGNDKFSQSINVIDKQEIEIKRLDDVLAEIVNDLENKKIFLKLDTQGYDIKVLHGANKILEYVYALQTEVSCKPIYKDTPLYFDALKEFHESGFNITGIFPLSHNDNSLELLEFDCVMTRSQ